MENKDHYTPEEVGEMVHRVYRLGKAEGNYIANSNENWKESLARDAAEELRLTRAQIPQNVFCYEPKSSIPLKDRAGMCLDPKIRNS